MAEYSSASIFDTWDTYRKVVAADFMFHRAIGTELNRELRAWFRGRPFSMLDLGCGDAATLLSWLEGLEPRRYKGVDLSETALALAADHLRALPCPVELARDHILAALAEEATYDVIHSSFALHHLPTEQKAEFFRLAAQRIDRGGLLLLVDVVREEDETLDVYHRRYCDWLRATWTGLDGDEKNLVCDHILHNDFPEPASVLEAQARAAGLRVGAGGARHGWHRVMCFTHEITP